MKSFFKIKNTVGLNIGVNDLTLMAFESGRNKPKILAYSSLKLDSAKAKTSLENQDGYLEEQLRTLLTKNLVGKFDANYIFVTIPTINTFSRTLQLPIKIKNDLANAIDLEVEQYIPVPRAALGISYEIINQDAENLNVSLSAAPTVILDRVIQIARSVDLEPILIEPSMNSIARLIINTEKGNLNTLIIDMEVSYTDIAILDKVVRVSSSIETGARHFTQAISTHLDVPPEKAQQLKVLSGFSKGNLQDKLTEALRPPMDNILTEVNKIVRYNTDRLGGQSIEQVIVVGNGSNIAGLSDFLTNELRLPVRIANPWQDFNFGKLPRPNRVAISRYLTVAGVAWLDPKEVLND